MATEPFSTNSDGNMFSGVSGYNTTDARSPALGRSSRDFVADTGPGAAAPGLFSAPDAETMPRAGDDPEADRCTGRDRKTNPNVDPDTRLGLRPMTRGMVAPQLSPYPESGPGTRAATGAVAGLIGVAVAMPLWYLAYRGWVAPPPPPVAAARAWFNAGTTGEIVFGVVASAVAGAALGALFGLVVRKPTILKGMIFGLVPALVQWLVVGPLTGQGLFLGGTAAGIGLPLLFDVLLWGAITGYFCGRWLRPPYSAAVDPDVTSAVPNP